jgi:hypothetical protein
VADLGKHRQVEPEFLQLVGEIKKRQRLCVSTSEELDRYIEQTRPATPFPVSSHIPDVLAKEIDEAREATVRTREHYKIIEKEFRALNSQARDVGLHHPDGMLAMRIAGRNLNSALEQYHAAVGRLTKLLSEATGQRMETKNNLSSSSDPEPNGDASQ